MSGRPKNPFELPPDAPETEALPALESPAPGASSLSEDAEETSSWTVGDLAERWRVSQDELSPRYREGPVLGRGGMGVVRLARDRRLRREIAVKTMRVAPTDTAAVARFLTEAQVTAQLTHPNIPPIHDLGLGPEGTAFFTMQALPGRTLKRLIADEGALGVGRALELFGKVCDAVDFAHSKGVLHRDLKPANVIIGDHGEIYVIDWGLAKKLDREGDVTTDTDESGEELTRRGVVIGTPGYMSPEQAAGDDQIDVRSDVYSLGALLYALLVGQSPFSGGGAAVVLKVHRGEFARPRKLRPELPWELEQVVLRAMALRREARYPTVAALKADLTAFLDGRPLPGVRYSAVRRLAKALARRRRTLIRAVAMGVAATLASIVVLAGYAVTLALARDRALAAERVAAGRALDLRIALARLHAEGGDAGAARRDLLDAIDRARELGRDARPARFALAVLDASHPPPEVRVPGAGTALLSPEGDRITLLKDRRVWVHDLLSGAPISSWPAPATGQLSLSDGPDGQPRLLVRDGATLARHVAGSVAWTMTLPSDPARDPLALSDDERVLAWTSGGRTRFLSVPDGTPAGPAVRGSVSRLSADGTRALAFSREGGPHRQLEHFDVIEVATGAVLGAYDGYEQLVTTSDLAWAVGDGTAGVGMDGTVAWTGELTLPKAALTAGEDEVVIFGADGTVEVRDPRSGELHLRRLVGEGRTAGGASPIVGSGWVGARIGDALHLWSLAEHPAEVAAHPAPAMGLSVSGDGELLATAGWEGDVAVWDRRSGLELARIPVSGSGVRDVAFAPDARRLATADRDGLVHVVDLATAELGAPLDAGRGIAMRVRWIDETRVVAAYEDGHLVVWDVASNEARSTLHHALKATWGMDVAAGRLLVAGRDGSDPHGELWDLETGERLATTSSIGVAYGAALSPDGGTWAIATSDGAIVVVDGGSERRIDTGLSEAVMSVAFSPDGELLVAGTFSGRLLVYDARSGAELLSVARHAGAIQDVRFVPETSTVLTLGGGPATWTALNLELTRDLAATSLTLVPGEAAPIDWHRVVERAELRWDWAHARAALEAAGAQASPLRLARARAATGDLEGARAALDRPDPSVLPGTLAAWRRRLVER